MDVFPILSKDLDSGGFLFKKAWFGLRELVGWHALRNISKGNELIQISEEVEMKFLNIL